MKKRSKRERLKSFKTFKIKPFRRLHTPSFGILHTSAALDAKPELATHGWKLHFLKDLSSERRFIREWDGVKWNHALRRLKIGTAANVGLVLLVIFLFGEVEEELLGVGLTVVTLLANTLFMLTCIFVRRMACSTRFLRKRVAHCALIVNMFDAASYVAATVVSTNAELRNLLMFLSIYINVVFCTSGWPSMSNHRFHGFIPAAIFGHASLFTLLIVLLRCNLATTILCICVFGGGVAQSLQSAFDSEKLAREKFLEGCVNEAIRDELRARNEELGASLLESQAVVDRVVKEHHTAINHWCISFQTLTFEKQIGMGSFGIVWRGLMHQELQDGEKRVVAIKTVRATKVTHDTIKSFMDEVAILIHLHHENLVQFLGGCWKDGPDKLAMLFEFCSNGDLESVLKEEEPLLSWSGVLYPLALGIAEAFKCVNLADQNSELLIFRRIV